MKILVCVSEFPPIASGIGNVAKFVTEEFSKKGHQCIICSPSGPDRVLGSYKLIDKFGGLGIIYFWYTVSKYFLSNQEEYDAIWLHQPLFVLKKSPFNKALITIHTTYNGKNNKKLKYSMVKKIYYRIMGVIENYAFRKLPSVYKYTYIDKELLSELSHIKIQKNCTLISNGVDLQKFRIYKTKNELRSKLGIDPNHTVLISVGRIIKVKRPFLMLDIFKHIQELNNKSTLIMVGHGDLLDDIKEYTLKNNINNVKFLGFVSHDNLPSLYSCADYYIMTSEYEGQPLTLLEAMSCGLPCIVSNIPNLTIVAQANCGVVIDFADKEKAIESIIDYVQKDNSESAINARKYAEEYLDWNIIANKYIHELKTTYN